MTRPSATRVLYALSGVATAAGAILFLLPEPEYAAPPPFAARDEGEISPYKTKELNGRYKELFNLAGLPKPVAPLPAKASVTASDPAAMLKTYRFLGGASAGDRNAALFETGGSVTMLRIGENLGEFTLVSFNNEKAIFKKKDIQVSLPLIEQ